MEQKYVSHVSKQEITKINPREVSLIKVLGHRVQFKWWSIFFCLDGQMGNGIWNWTLNTLLLRPKKCFTLPHCWPNHKFMTAVKNSDCGLYWPKHDTQKFRRDQSKHLVSFSFMKPRAHITFKFISAFLCASAENNPPMYTFGPLKLYEIYLC